MPTPEQLLGTIASLVLIGALLKMFLRKPSIEAEFATKLELRASEARTEDRIARMDEKLDERFAFIDAKRSRQVAALHEDIRGVDVKVERLLGRLEGQ